MINGAWDLQRVFCDGSASDIRITKSGSTITVINTEVGLILKSDNAKIELKAIRGRQITGIEVEHFYSSSFGGDKSREDICSEIYASMEANKAAKEYAINNLSWGREGYVYHVALFVR